MLIVNLIIREEGREADYVLKATIELDLKAMEEFWSDAKEHNYSYIGNHSSDAVMKVLEAGNDEFVVTTNPFIQIREPNANWTESDYVIWIREKIASFRLQGVKRGLR